VDATKNGFRATNIKTLPYPGFPTDVQPQFMAFLSTVPGRSLVIETVFENRFMHIRELNLMSACITEEGRRAIIKGGAKLTGAHVRATDLRAGAALVLAGLVAEGTTVVSDIYHIDRGYENFVSKLEGLGAGITRTEPESNGRV
jgi:UDP-N-acetylglucosamine 1-carboxyvinyltransferase